MDKKLEDALTFCNYRLTLNSQLQVLKLKSENSLVFAKNGGIFRIDENLISFLSIFQQRNIESVVLLDSNKNPILIENIETFLEEILSTYIEVTNDYLNEYTKIRNCRSVESLVDFGEDDGI